LEEVKGQVYSKAEDARKAIISERITKQNETLRNQDMLNIAKLFKSYPFYWPAVHDFRGRIYRVSNLNIQMNPL
jgi:DNA-directed RNA polymerase